MGPRTLTILSLFQKALGTYQYINMDALKNMAEKVTHKDQHKGSQQGEQEGHLEQGVGVAGKQMGQDWDKGERAQYSEYLREGYHQATGREIPLDDKEVIKSQVEAEGDKVPAGQKH